MPKAKVKSAYVCQECGAEHAKWQGQCHACGEWNSLSRVTISPVAGSAASHQALGFAGVEAQIQKLSEVEALDTARIGSGFNELDRVLGGGFVPGSVVLIGGDPGAGKSTLLLQACTKLAANHGVLYVTGEESLQQLALRAQRLKIAHGWLKCRGGNSCRGHRHAYSHAKTTGGGAGLSASAANGRFGFDPGFSNPSSRNRSIFYPPGETARCCDYLGRPHHQRGWIGRTQSAGAYDRLFHDAGQSSRQSLSNTARA